MKRFNEIRDNGTVDFGDIYACDLKYDVIVDIYDKQCIVLIGVYIVK